MAGVVKPAPYSVAENVGLDAPTLGVAVALVVVPLFAQVRLPAPSRPIEAYITAVTVARVPAPPRRLPQARPVRAAGAVVAAGPGAGGQGDLLDLLSVSGVALDEVVRASGLPVAAVQAMLSDLEIEGRVVRLAGGKVARATPA